MFMLNEKDFNMNQLQNIGYQSFYYSEVWSVGILCLYFLLEIIRNGQVPLGNCQILFDSLKLNRHSTFKVKS